jgi:hypothetical protein
MPDEETNAEANADPGWDRMLQASVRLSGARGGLLVVKDGGVWRKVLLEPGDDAVFRSGTLDRQIMAALAAGSEGLVDAGERLWVRRLPRMEEVVMVLRGGREWAGPDAGTDRLLALLAEIPGLRRLAAPGERLGGRIENLALVLDLVVLANSVDGFREALLKVVNEVAARCHCQRVSVGWLRGGFTRLRAISHAEKVERKSPLVTLVEAAMDECAEQDTEIILPLREDDSTASRDHGILVAETRNDATVSLPLRDQGAVVGVILVEREQPWTAGELAALRLTADLLGPVLAGMERRSRWVGARLWHTVRGGAGKLMGHQHTGWKLCGLGGIVALAILFLGGKTYKVEATFMVESDSVALITAPYDGFLDEAGIRVGDEVAAGGLLFSLATRDLSLEEAQVAAEWRRQTATALKAEGEGKLPEMRIAQAAAAQAEARLELVRYRLGQARAKAPFAAVVVEGDLREKLGAPLSQGEVMVKLVRLDDLYLELQIDERDIAEVTDQSGGEIAFTANPARRFACRLTGIEPATRPREAGNGFVARAVAADGVQPWWRPGMGGVAKIHVGRRSFWWILTHRTVDFLRMKLWW